MKSIKRPPLTVLIAATAVLLCGCSGDAGLPDVSASACVPLGVGGLYLEAAPATRAGTPVATNGATIGVFLTNEGGYTPVYNKTYTLTSDNWGSADPVYVDNRTGKAVAVYDPHHLVTFGANSTVTTGTLQAQSYSENLLWYYDNTTGAAVSSTNSMLAFSMKCAYSRLSFSILRNAGYSPSCKVSRIVIKPSADTFYTAARVDITDGALTGTTSADYIIDTSALPINTVGISAGFTDTSIDHLFPAQTLAAGAGLAFTLTVDGRNYSATVPAATFNEIRAGVQYTVHLEIAGSGMTVGSVSTTDWVTSSGNIDSSFD